MWFFLSIYAVGLISFFIHLFKLAPAERTYANVLELFLLYQIVFSLGITSLVAFIGLTFMDVYVAQITDWPVSPFEQQMANVNLGFGVLGIMSIWYRGYFWLATVVGFSVWILSDGIQHIYYYLVKHNATEGNIGVPLYTDIIVPIVLLILTCLYFRNSQTRQAENVPEQVVIKY